jgi:hypothetical protein
MYSLNTVESVSIITEPAARPTESKHSKPFYMPVACSMTNESKAPKSAVDRRIEISEWEWMGCCLDWDYPHHVMDRMDEQTCEGSNCEGTGEDSLTSSYGRSCNSYDDKGLRESSHSFFLRVDQVLILSAMSDEMSGIFIRYRRLRLLTIFSINYFRT